MLFYAMRVVPAILAETFDGFLSLLKEAESFAGYVQIDVMDGTFVPSRSFPFDKINGASTPLPFEVHLMVSDPVSFIRGITHPGLRKVIYHFEAVTDHGAVMRAIRARHFAPGLAVKPETKLEAIKPVAEEVDTLLFLTVDPGFYASPFRPEVLDTVAVARKMFPRKEIAVDGGVSLANVKRFADLGIDYVCVGSRIFLDGDPGENYRLFVAEIEEAGKK